MERKKLVMFVEGAVMVALASVLSLIKVYKLPLGGSITLLSMLPIVLYSIKYGVKNGMFVSFVYSLVQLGFGFVFDGLMGWGMTAKIWFGCVAFDYIIAFSVLGLAGAFRKLGTKGYIFGIVMSLALRFASHFVSGSIFFDVWMPEEWSNPFFYSLCYNGSYMLPELIFTTVGAVALLKLPHVRKLVKPVE